MSGDREAEEAERFDAAFRGRPDGDCIAHPLTPVVMVSQWWQHSGTWPVLVCTLCAIRGAFNDLVAVWDGQDWQTEDVDAAWRDAWCSQTGHDIEAGRSTWALLQSRADPTRPVWWRKGAARGAWALAMRNPEIGALRAWTLVTAAQALQDGDLLVEQGDAVKLAELVDGSRSRWESYHSALWQELSPQLRGRVLALGDAPMADDDFAGFPTGDVYRFDAIAAAVEQNHPLTWRDHHAWARQRSNSNLTQMRMRGLIRWRIESGVALEAAEHVAVQPERHVRPIYGPNIDAVTVFLAEAAALDDLDRAFLRSVLPPGWNNDRANPETNPLQDAWWLAGHRSQRLLMDDARNALIASGQGSWWSDSRTGRGEDLEAVWLAAQAAQMDGLMDKAAVDRLMEPYKRARAAAATVRQAGPRAVQRAIELAPRWTTTPEALAEEVVGVER